MRQKRHVFKRIFLPNQAIPCIMSDRDFQVALLLSGSVTCIQCSDSSFITLPS
jgi:hypothetical protein